MSRYQTRRVRGSCASEVEDRQSERSAAENRRTQLQARKLEDEAVRCAPERGAVKGVVGRASEVDRIVNTHCWHSWRKKRKEKRTISDFGHARQPLRLVSFRKVLFEAVVLLVRLVPVPIAISFFLTPFLLLFRCGRSTAPARPAEGAIEPCTVSARAARSESEQEKAPLFRFESLDPWGQESERVRAESKSQDCGEDEEGLSSERARCEFETANVLERARERRGLTRRFSATVTRKRLIHPFSPPSGVVVASRSTERARRAQRASEPLKSGRRDPTRLDDSASRRDHTCCEDQDTVSRAVLDLLRNRRDSRGGCGPITVRQRGPGRRSEAAWRRRGRWSACLHGHPQCSSTHTDEQQARGDARESTRRDQQAGQKRPVDGGGGHLLSLPRVSHEQSSHHAALTMACQVSSVEWKARRRAGAR